MIEKLKQARKVIRPEWKELYTLKNEAYRWGFDH
jgi:hypothetical protein